MGNARDNFTKPTIKTLAMRVGYFCSNPACRTQTAGASSDENKAVHCGVAAHITAAAPGGERYDPNLTSKQRSSLLNGIWLCSNCARIIDVDPDRYPTDLLYNWKKDAEAFSFRTYATSVIALPAIKLNFEFDDFDPEFLQALGISSEETIKNTIKKVRKAALNDIAKFINMQRSAYTIPLPLTLQDSNSLISVTLEGVAKSIMVSQNVNIISDPGMGKSTTLIRLTESILNAGDAVAVLIPLGEWSDYSDNLFELLIKRNSFRSLDPKHFMQLACYGRLALILDGWNELESKTRMRIRRDIDALRRDYPQLGVVVSSRSQETYYNEGVVIKIDPLSDAQQMEIARNLCGEKGEAAIDQAWRIPSLRELITIPLYLNAFLGSVPLGVFPQTKEEILNLFVKEHEKSPLKKEILENKLLGLQKEILADLAYEINANTSTSLSEDKVRRSISKTMKKLQDEGQIATALQPVEVINALIDNHLLIRTSPEGTSVSFQHQQFQEWYASFKVEQLMLDSFGGDEQSKSVLRKDILNWSAWEESILFACERLSRKNVQGVKIVAAAILDALSIDPMLSAEMIYRSTPEVWLLINSKIMNFVRSWYKPRTVDRAIRFMIISGRDDFFEFIWPLISSSENQIYFQTLHIAPRFRSSVLGSDVKDRLMALPENTRGHIIAEIGQRGGFDEIELSASLAVIDKSPQVIVEILESLHFRHAHRHVKEILHAASDEVWKLIASKDYPRTFKDSEQNERLTKMRDTLIASEKDPIKIINYLTEYCTNLEGVEERIIQLISSEEFPVENNNVPFCLEKAFKIYPQAIVSAIIKRISESKKIPYGVEEYLNNVPLVDEGPIIESILNPSCHKFTVRAVCKVLGPLAVEKILDALFAMNEKFCDHKLTSEETTEYHRLFGIILLSPLPSFLSVFIKRSDTEEVDQIELMTDLLFRHGKDDETCPLIVTDDLKLHLKCILKKWITFLLNLTAINQKLLANLVRAITRLPDKDFIEDLHAMLKREVDLQTKSQGTRSAVIHDFRNQYRQAFSAIGGDKVIQLMKNYLSDMWFGVFAACVLSDIWNKGDSVSKKKAFFPSNNFSEIKENRIKLQSSDLSRSCEISDEIFKIAADFSMDNKSESEKLHAIDLAKIALGISYEKKHNALLKSLYNLPLRFGFKKNMIISAALAGEILPVKILNDGLNELLTDAVEKPYLLEENSGKLMSWIELYAFSDDPTSVIMAIDLLSKRYHEPWRLSRLFSALGHSPHVQALETLKALGEQNPEIKKQADWLNAVFNIKTEDSGRFLFNLIREGVVFEQNNPLLFLRLSKNLASLMSEFPVFRDEILQSYSKILDSKAKEIIKNSLLELSDQNIILFIIKNSICVDKQEREYDVLNAIQNIAIGRREAKDWPGAFEQFSNSLIEFRKQLFDMIVDNVPQSFLARACLIKIDVIRDEYGRPNDEPKHPDIISGSPWPSEALL